MTLSRWLKALGVAVLLSCARVAQQQALYLKGYAVGERVHRLHEETTAVAWLEADVNGLAAPATLAKTERDRQLKLVARRELSPRPGDRVYVRMAAAAAGGDDD